jgi:hypothetical protein
MRPSGWPRRAVAAGRIESYVILELVPEVLTDCGRPLTGPHSLQQRT